MDEISYVRGDESAVNTEFWDLANSLCECGFFGVGPAPEKGFDTKFTEMSLWLQIALRQVQRTMQCDFHLQSRNSRTWWDTADESSLHHKQDPEGSKGYSATGRKTRMQEMQRRDTRPGSSHFCCWILHWSLYATPATSFFRGHELKLSGERHILNRDVKNITDY